MIMSALSTPSRRVITTGSGDTCLFLAGGIAFTIALFLLASA
jgi:hypothetical protein